MDFEQWTTTVSDAAARFSEPLSADERARLRAPFTSSSERHQAIGNRLIKSLLREIFRRAASGLSFGDPGRVSELLYDTLENAYPGGSATFVKTVRAILTFWAEYLDIAHREPKTRLQVVLLETIGQNKKVFFPAVNIRTPAPRMIFESSQRDFLRVYGPDLDVEDFLQGNPLLTRSVNPLKGSGCLGLAVAGTALFPAMWFFHAHLKH